jgi:aspartyl-tRNA(Asn)/glutamyl-tRNA(Gln) amidotransferase subunit C
MSDLDKKTVKHVAKLANLELKKKEVDKYLKQLSEVLNYVAELEEVDTNMVKVTSNTTEIVNATREDKIDSKNTLKQKEATSQAQNTYNGYFVVPMLLEERTDY